MSKKPILNAIFSMIAYYILWPYKLTCLLHKLRGVKIENINNTVIAYHVFIDPICPELITIEDGVWITQHCIILAHFRPTPYLNKIIGGDRKKPVRICKGAYIGMGSIILPGVTIGENAVIGSGSVVTKDVPPNMLAAGNPAKVIKRVENIKP